MSPSSQRRDFCNPVMNNIRPLLTGEHGLDAPARAEDVERFGEAIVVNEARVDGEEPHHENNVAPVEEGCPYLQRSFLLVEFF